MRETRETIHTKIAADAFPNGIRLECSKPGCDRGEVADSARAADYLAHGWPTHHGLTMRLVSPKPAGAP